jgi:peroxiredoxin
MPLTTGTAAPSFKLPCKPGEEVDVGAALGKEKVVLLFFPAFLFFSTSKLCSLLLSRRRA